MVFFLLFTKNIYKICVVEERETDKRMVEEPFTNIEDGNKLIIIKLAVFFSCL